ncbi:hypothetical protein RAS2_16910 [Phycisphaerae bacterium RAS2]|nr:hypothetical protein RAS2_16910 [Phycisphaerae bacterium RAS2]
MPVTVSKPMYEQVTKDELLAVANGGLAAAMRVRESIQVKPELAIAIKRASGATPFKRIGLTLSDGRTLFIESNVGLMVGPLEVLYKDRDGKKASVPLNHISRVEVLEQSTGASQQSRTTESASSDRPMYETIDKGDLRKFMSGIPVASGDSSGKSSDERAVDALHQRLGRIESRMQEMKEDLGESHGRNAGQKREDDKPLFETMTAQSLRDDIRRAALLR